MYKTKIQQLCHSRSWNLPDYQTIRDGPDHNPSFISTVTVNGLHFQSPEPTRTSKESQNNAAKLAFHHFSQPVNPNPNPKTNPNQSPTPNPPRSLPQLSSFPGCSFPQPSLSLSVTSTTPPFVSFGPNNGGVDSGVLQAKAVEGSQTSQISSPVKATTMTTGDQKNMQHLYKNQLQNFAHKKNLNLPVYSSEWEGPPHALRFKCKVTIDGQTFESSKFFSTLKDAEHAAAEVALMSLSPGVVQEDQTGLYKNLLQEFVQKEGFRLPSYNTNRYGESHMPTFVSQVEIEGETFTGQEAKSKKQAETSAAKVAYMTLKERKGMSDQSSLFPLSAHHGQAPEFSSDRSEANVIIGLQHHANLKSPVTPGLVTKNQLDKSKAHHGQAPEFSFDHSEANVITGLQHHANLKSPVSPGLVTKNQLDKSKAHHGQAPEFSSGRSEANVVTGLQHHANLKSPVSPGLVTKNQLYKIKEPVTVTVTEKIGSSSSGNTNGRVENFSLSNIQSEPSLSDSTNVVSDTSKMPSTQVSTPSCRDKVVVYSRNTNMEIEGGGSMRPISDDKWVVYSYSH